MKRFLMVAAMCVVGVAAQGQATRTWVSGVGDDVNPCSRTAPCKTFAGAISKTAAGGEISVLDPGGYGTLTATKSITVQGTGTLASMLNSSISGLTVNGAGIVVTLRDISINGAGTTLGVKGVRFVQGSKLTLERVNIFNQSSHCVSIEAAGTINLEDVTLYNCQGAGYSAQPTVPPAVTKSSLNNVKTFMNGTGIYIANGGIASIRNSMITNNTNQGVVSEENSGSTEVNIEDSVIANNAVGILAGNNSTTRISNCNIFNNTANGFSIAGTGAIISFGNNRIAGNGGVTNNPTSTVLQQ